MVGDCFLTCACMLYSNSKTHYSSCSLCPSWFQYYQNVNGYEKREGDQYGYAELGLCSSPGSIRLHLGNLYCARGSLAHTNSTESFHESPNDYRGAWRPAVGSFGEVGRPSPSVVSLLHLNFIPTLLAGFSGPACFTSFSAFCTGRKGTLVR